MEEEEEEEKKERWKRERCSRRRRRGRARIPGVGVALFPVHTPGRKTGGALFTVFHCSVVFYCSGLGASTPTVEAPNPGKI